MISKIKEFFSAYLSEDNAQGDNIEHKLNLASAALMIEMIHVDHEVKPEEEKKLRSILENDLTLTADEIDKLLAIAHDKKHQAVDYYQFTSIINQHYTQEQKIGLVKNLWQIAYADNELDKFEEHLVRKLAELLHVPHSAFMQSKHSVIK